MRRWLRFACFGFLFLLVLVNLARFLNFSLNLSGLDDSGWYFGVAENLALKGKYASLTNPAAVEPEFTPKNQVAITPDIFNRTSIIGRDSLDYFPVGVSVGPGIIVPVALMIKIFGVGYWQLRLFPTTTYCLFLFTTLWLAYQQGGIIASLILIIFLNFFPGLAIPLGYEALAEPTGFLYLILGGMLLSLSFRQKKKETVFLAASGIFFSLAGLTKFLYFLNFLPAVGLYFYFIKKEKQRFKKTIILFLGFFLPVFLFEIYRFIVLFRLGGLLTWLANLGMNLLFFISAGSGFGESQISGNILETIFRKMEVFSEIGFSNFLLTAVLLISLTTSIFLKWRQKKDFLPLVFSFFWLTNLIWFFLISATGWARHFWPGLILTIFFLSVFIGDLFFRLKIKTRKVQFLIAFTVAISLLKTITPSFIYQINFKNQTLISWQKKFMEKKPFGAALPLPIFPLWEQKTAVDFIKGNILPEEIIFYVGSLMVSEIPPLVNRVFYSTELILKTKIAPQKTYVIFGPYQVNPDWRLISFEEYKNQLEKYCSQEVFGNGFYKICLLGKS